MDTKNFESPFQFIGSRIIKYNQTNNFYSLKLDQELQRSVDVEYDISDISNDNDNLFGALQLTINIEIKEKTKEKLKKKYKCLLIIEGYFKSDNKISESDFINMLEINGCASLFSVARSFIISVSSQSVLQGQIVLPLLNIVNMNKKIKSEKRKTATLKQEEQNNDLNKI